MWQIKLTRPLGDRFGFAVMSNKKQPSFIIALLLWRSPFAVLRRVALRIVDALYRMAWRRPSTHIRKEQLDVRLPSFTDGNTAFAIVSILAIVWILASLPHMPVDPILRTMSFAVGCICFCALLDAVTPTGNSGLTKQRTLLYDLGRPADTLNVPSSIAFPTGRLTQDRQATKLATYPITHDYHTNTDSVGKQGASCALHAS